MKFAETAPDISNREAYAMLSDCGNYSLCVYKVNIGAMRIRIYTKRSGWMMSPIDWCLGTNKPLAERMFGLILKYLGGRDDLGKLDWGDHSYSKRKPIHNDQEFLNKVLSLVDEPFEPHKLTLIHV